MKVLYVLLNYPQDSESYVDVEIDYVRSRGVEVEVWSPVVGWGNQTNVPVHRKSFREAVDRVKPNLVHIHHLIAVSRVIQDVPNRIPVTVRVHSFDWGPQAAIRCAAVSSVRAIYMFPHFAESFPHFAEKVVPMTVAFDPSQYPFSVKEKRTVVRTAAGLPTKNLLDFLTVGNRVDDAHFILSVCPPSGDRTYAMKTLPEQNRRLGGRVSVHNDLFRGHATAFVRGSEIYMSTSDPSAHPFGMPISIAEAMSTGAYILVRDSKAARDYVGNAGAFYGSADEAVSILRASFRWDAARWKEAAEASWTRSKLFTAETVLPRLVDDWKRFAN